MLPFPLSNREAPLRQIPIIFISLAILSALTISSSKIKLLPQIKLKYYQKQGGSYTRGHFTIVLVKDVFVYFSFFKEYPLSAHWLLSPKKLPCEHSPSLQIINAALALAARPKSQVVKKNMEMYKHTWENHIHVLTEAVDDITSIDDFLAVSGMF